ncbi:MAG: TraR/DksA C4-type zinc finger protein [Hyphomicrobiales bacterium]|nr:TraR/DksA C4-type zinc finger protein [Hyphomicrobiales bacterium]
MTVDTDIARAALQARQDELEKLSESSADARATVTLDQASVGRLSRMDALQSQAMAQATERQRAAELARIKSALLRMEEDEYGYCIVCGEEIAPKRLEIDPAASHCVKCAK